MSTFKQVIDLVTALGLQAEHILPHLASLQSEFQALTIVNTLSAKVAGITEQEDVDHVLQDILDAALQLSEADRGLIVTTNPHHEDGFEIKSANRITQGDGVDLRFSKTLIQTILERGESIKTTNATDDDLSGGSSIHKTDIRSVMAAPFKYQGDVIGGVYVDSVLHEKHFEAEDLTILSAFAHHAAATLNLATSMQERYEVYVQSILALVNAIEAADAYTSGHSSRVGYYSRGIAQEMGLSDRDIHLITFAGYLHDVGKIALKSPVSIDPKLTDEEWIEMKRHPIYGERILRNSPALEEILPGVRSHHEKWAGGGYPDNIQGEDIHLYARIIVVADTFDAMTTDRPYRKAFETDYALSEIETLKGNWYYPPAAEAFLKAFAEGSLINLADSELADAELYTGYDGLITPGRDRVQPLTPIQGRGPKGDETEQ